MSKHGPPGWKPNEIFATRIDGWVVDPNDPMEPPREIAEAIFRSALAGRQHGPGLDKSRSRSGTASRQRNPA